MGNWIARELVSPCLGEKTAENNCLSGMEESFLRFDHLPEQIFEMLDNKSLVNSRVVRGSWCNFIDARDYPWKRFQEVINDLSEEWVFGETVFHLCTLQSGH